jgi:dTDP-4-dehydrorhamnose 3,5-epimerase
VIFEETAISGVWRVSITPVIDERGFFARLFCVDEFASYGLPTIFEQLSLSRNSRCGTLRGLHYQPDPYAEAKYVRCTRGSVFDVAVDLRVDSPTCGRWIGEVLSVDNGIGLYIAPGIAHGFQTLEADTDVLYHITPAYRPGLGSGVRWNDPAFGITWPLLAPILSVRDADYEDWRP